MKTIWFFLFSLLLGGMSYGQYPVRPQVYVPVYHELGSSGNTWLTEQNRLADLCGTAFYFLDTTEQHDHLHVTDDLGFMVWTEKVGVSTLVDYIVSDGAHVSRLSLQYSNGACQVEVWQDSSRLSHGNLVRENGRDIIRMRCLPAAEGLMVQVLKRVNTNLVGLFRKKLSEIPITSPLFFRDTLNLVIGPDQQFDTDYDLVWFDKSLYERLRQLAVKDARQLSGRKMMEEAFGQQGDSRHRVMRDSLTPELLHGRLTLPVRLHEGGAYLFLKPKADYEVSVDYDLFVSGNRQRLSLQKLILLNRDTRDFVEMNLTDVVEQGVPVLYLHLIIGVVMEDDGRWSIGEVLRVVQEALRDAVLPYE